jgi:uncharacterized protein YwgA
MTKTESLAAIVVAAGGSVISKARLQKMAYLLTLAGELEGFNFRYRYYAPYSEDLDIAVEAACASSGLIKEEKSRAAWGGTYSIYKIAKEREQSVKTLGEIGVKLVSKAIDSDPVVHELAATAAYFANKKYKDPWEETAGCKSDKAAEGRLEKAKELYAELRSIAPKLPEATRNIIE